MSRRHHRRARFLQAGVALGAALALAGCTGTSTPAPSTPTPTVTAPSTPSATPTPTPSVDPAVAAAEAAALEAYRGFWAAQVAYLAAPAGPEPPELQQYAVDKALSGVRSAAELFALNGIVAQGAPALAPEVSQLELDGMASATIVDCVDITNWQTIYVSTGESAAAPGQLLRQQTESYVFVYDGRWVVGETTVYRDRTC